MTEDLYKLLGVERNASKDEIKKAYRAFSKKWHPDLQQGKDDATKKEAEEMFKRGSDAYEILSDDAKRAQYDAGGMNGPSMMDFSEVFGNYQFDRHFFKDFSFNFGREMGNHFGFDFGNKKQEKPDFSKPENGKSFKTDIHVSLENIIFGDELKIKIDCPIVCSHCHGKKIDPSENSEVEECHECHGTGTKTVIRGMIATTCQNCKGFGYVIHFCNHCEGTGKIIGQKTIKINIPAGIKEGDVVRVMREGDPGLNGGKNGDIYFYIYSKPNKFFKRINPYLGILISYYLIEISSL